MSFPYQATTLQLLFFPGNVLYTKVEEFKSLTTAGSEISHQALILQLRVYQENILLHKKLNFLVQLFLFRSLICSFSSLHCIVT